LLQLAKRSFFIEGIGQHGRMPVFFTSEPEVAMGCSISARWIGNPQPAIWVAQREVVAGFDA